MPLPTDLAAAHALILRQRDELAAAEVRDTTVPVLAKNKTVTGRLWT